MTPIQRAVGLLLTTLAVASCSSTNTSPAQVASTEPSTATSTETATVASAQAPRADDSIVGAVEAQLAASPAGCDPLDARQCLLPFPSDALTVVDDNSPTKLRVAFPAGELPANSSGIGIDPTSWNRNDGFSANSPLLAWIEDFDPEASTLPSWTDLDVDSAADDGQLLVVRPAISLAPATTYAVGLRNLVTTTGTPVEPSPMFTLAGLGTTAPEFAITSVTENPEPGLARLVEGTYSVPNWMTGDGGPGTSPRCRTSITRSTAPRNGPVSATTTSPRRSPRSRTSRTSRRSSTG